jgi:catechol 2,3-dioxygenase-like lactoylglutathione lyase family enzyme
MYLSCCGIRVTDLERSLKFYTELFGLKEVAIGDRSKHGAGAYVLLRENIIQGTYNIQDYLENVAKRINQGKSIPEQNKALSDLGEILNKHP